MIPHVAVTTKLLFLLCIIYIYMYKYITVQTYFQLLDRTYFALLVVLLTNWTFILWVVHQLSLHDPLSRFNTSQRWTDGKNQGMGEEDEDEDEEE